MPSGDSNTLFGQSAALIGNINGDGVGDIALGGPHDGSSDDGMVVLMFLETTGQWAGYGFIQPADVGLPEGKGANLGWALAAVDDANDDGVQDLAVSSIGDASVDGGAPYQEGAVHVVRLTSSGNVLGHTTFSGSSLGLGNSASLQFGRGIAAVGDWIRSGGDDWEDGNDDGNMDGI